MITFLIPEKWVPSIVAAARHAAALLLPRAGTEAADGPAYCIPEITVSLRADSIVTTDEGQAPQGKRC
jgi:hypothetical protein